VVVQVSVEPGAVSASSAQVGRAGETFAAMSQALRGASTAAASVAGTPHAETGLSDFGDHWSTVLRVMAAGGSAVQAQLDAAARRYVAVDGEIARAVPP
jgi:hypothetical protein